MDLNDYQILYGDDLKIVTLKELLASGSPSDAGLFLTWFLSRIMRHIGIPEPLFDQESVSKMVEFLENIGADTGIT